MGKDGTLSKAAIRAAKKAGQDAARYLPADPEFWLRQCALAGINVVEHAERLMICTTDLARIERKPSFSNPGCTPRRAALTPSDPC